MNNAFTFFRSRTLKHVMAALAVWSLMAPAFQAFALPQGGSIRGGNVSWETIGDLMKIHQLSGRAIINWNSFSIGSQETVQFVQPNSSAAILNRVTGPYSSEIFGSLLANGNVYLINPNGILFGAGSRVNVSGLVASTFDISDADFNAGRLNFTRLANSSGRVVNQGEITASSFAYLLGAGVENAGTIRAPAVALAAGRDKIVIDRTDTGGEIRLSVDPGMAAISFAEFDDAALMPNVFNSGIVDASGKTGGQVLMQGANVVQTGTVRADGTTGGGGQISLQGERLVTLGAESVTTANAGLDGDGGRIEIVSQDYAGIYDGAQVAARGGSRSGDGGFVETSGHQSFVIEAAPDVGADNGRGGEWLIDPHNIEIVTAADVGWIWDNNDMLAIFDNAKIKVSNILEGLAKGDVTILTGSGGAQDGNITVNADIGYTAHPGTTLTLDAANDINLNANITAGAENTLGLTAGGDVVQAGGKVVQLGTVDFDVAGDVTMNSSANKIDTLTGDVGGNLGLVNNASLDLDGLHVDNGATTLTVAGDLTNTGANTIKDLTATTTGDIVLDAANDFGEVTANANNGAGAITFNDVNSIVLRDIDGGTLDVTAQNGSITQTGDTRVMIAGESTLNATEQIMLFNGANDFGGPVSASAKDIQLRDKNNIVLDNVTAGTDGLIVQTDGGAITQTEEGMVSVEGETHLLARNNTDPADILLGNEANDFIGAVHADGANVELADANHILLGRVDAAGTLDVSAHSGDITQTDDGITVQGETTLSAFGDITLDNTINDFVAGPVHADGANIALTDANNILLGRVDAEGTLDVTALDGDITQTDDGVVAVGEATLMAEGNNVTLDSENNDFQNTVNAYADNVTLTDGADGISIGRIKKLADTDDAADKVIITARNGGISDAQNDTVSHDADGFATQAGDRIVNIISTELLLDADADIGAAGNPLDIEAGTLAARSKEGSVWLFETDALTLGTVNGVSGIFAAQNAKLETLNGALTVDQAVSATSGDILLAVNGAGSDVTLNAAVDATSGNVTILAANSVAQNTAITAGQTIDVEAKAGSITMIDGASATADGNIRYLAAQDAAITGLNGANVRVEATAGSITDAGDTLADVTAQTAQFVAGGFVGGAGNTESDDNPQALDTAVATLAAQAGESIYVSNAGGALELGDVAAIDVNRVALDSTLTPIEGDDVSGATAGQNVKVVNNGGAFTVSAPVTATQGDILLWSQTDALNVNADLTAGDLVTLAGNGVALDADITAGGDVTIDGGAGSVTYNTGYGIDAGSIRMTADGDIALDAITARDLVNIIAGGSITDANADETANITASRVRLDAGGAIGSASNTESDTNPLALDIAADNIEAHAVGSIYLQSQAGVTIGGVGETTTSYARFDSGTTVTHDADLTGITSDTGVVKLKTGDALNVNEAVSAGTDALLLTTAGDITLDAALNAGGKATLIAAGRVNQNANITAGGDVYLDGGDGITANGTLQSGGNVGYRSAGDIAVDRITADGLVNLVAGGNITDANHDLSANIIADRIRLEADGSVGSASDALDVESRAIEVQAGGEAHLRSDGDIVIGGVGEGTTSYARFDSGTTTMTDPDLSGFTTGGDASLTSANGDIRQTQDSDHVDIGGASWLQAPNGDIALENPLNDFRGRVDALARNIALRDRNDLLVGQVNATRGGHVRLTAGGSILGLNAMPNVIAGTAEFYAGHDIGSPLYIDVGMIHEARAGNDIHLVQVAGDMRILGQVYAGRDVRLDVWHGGIVDADGDGYVPPIFVNRNNADIYSGRRMTLIADFVGTWFEPVELLSKGPLSLDTHRAPATPNGAYPWVVINGHVGGGAQNIWAGRYGSHMRGVVIYNGQIVLGPWWTVQQFQLAQRSLFDRNQPSLLDTGIAKLPWFLQPDLTLLSPSPVRDDLRPPQEMRVTGGEDIIPDNSPRVKTIGIPVTMLDKTL